MADSNYSEELEQEIGFLLEEMSRKTMDKKVAPKAIQELARKQPKVEIKEDFAYINNLAKDITNLDESGFHNNKVTLDPTIEITDRFIAAIKRDEKLEEVSPLDEYTESRFAALSRQIMAVSNTVNTISENTLVSGIGHGPFGQAPGGGAARLVDQDDVLIDRHDLVGGEVLVWDGHYWAPTFVSGVGGDVTGVLPGNGISVDSTVPGGKGQVTVSLDATTVAIDTSGASSGQTLVFDGTNFVPAEASKGEITTIIAGDGITVTPADGKGDVTVALDPITIAIDTSGASAGQTLRFDGTEFIPVENNTENLVLTTPGDPTTYAGNVPATTLNTQKDVNEYLVDVIIDLGDRVTSIENDGGGGGGSTPGDPANVDLEYTAYPDRGVIENTGGDDATIPLADTTNAGLLDPADKEKINNLPDSGIPTLDEVANIDNVATTTLEATGFVVTGGQATEYLMADGSTSTLVIPPSGVTSIIQGEGLEIDPADGEGDVTISLNAGLADLQGVDDALAPTEGQALLFHSGEWVAANITAGDDGADVIVEAGDGIDVDETAAGDVVTYTVKLDASLNDINNVDLTTAPNEGEVLTFVGGDWKSAQPALTEAVTSLNVGAGSSIVLSDNTGDITISLEDSLEELGEVDFDFTDLGSGDLMVYDGTKFVVKVLNTEDILLKSAIPWSSYSKQPLIITTPTTISTQKEANEAIVDLINDLDDRVIEIENRPEESSWKGNIDATEAANEPDDPSNGDMYANSGGAGLLWGTGDPINDGDRIIYTESTDVWDIIHAAVGAPSLDEILDVSITDLETGQILISDGTNFINAPNPAPVVFKSAGEPTVNDDGVKNGDFWIKTPDNILHNYQDPAWVVVGGEVPDALVAIGENKPTQPVHGMIWIDTTDLQYVMYTYDTDKWIGLTTDLMDFQVPPPFDGGTINTDLIISDADLTLVGSDNEPTFAVDPNTAVATLGTDNKIAPDPTTNHDIITNGYLEKKLGEITTLISDLTDRVVALESA